MLGCLKTGHLKSKFYFESFDLDTQVKNGRVNSLHSPVQKDSTPMGRGRREKNIPLQNVMQTRTV